MTPHHKFEVSLDAYNALAVNVVYRLYTLTGSGELINIEAVSLPAQPEAIEQQS